MGIEITTTEKIVCKHCGSEGVVRYGSYKGVPRYFCKACERKFKADDNLSGNRAPTSQISSALNLYYDGESIRAIGRHLKQETGHSPSTDSTYGWIQRYSQYLTESIKKYPLKNIGNEWVADETVLKIGGSQIWLWDIIDTRTRVLLASRLARSRTTRDAQMLIDKAVRTAGKHPESVITDQLNSYLDVFYGDKAEHRQGSPFSKEDSTSKIERWHGTLKSRTKVMRGLKNFETANDFTQSYLAYYNYLRPHESLGNKTPAEEAGVAYPYRNWDDVIRNYQPSHKIEVTHTERSISLMPKNYVGRRPAHIRISPKSPRITPTETANIKAVTRL